MDRPAGSFIWDEDAGEFKPNLADKAMAARQPACAVDAADRPAEKAARKSGRPEGGKVKNNIGPIGPIEEESKEVTDNVEK